MLIPAFFALVLAIFLIWKGAQQQQAAGLPGGRVIYTDTRAWGKIERALYDPTLNLTGMPDYVVQEGENVIPVEVKTGRTPQAPYDSHIYQLAAYCLLVQRNMGKRPPYGIIKYPNRTFAIDYTTELENALLDILLDIRAQERKRSVNRAHENPARCKRCGYRTTCDQVIH